MRTEAVLVLQERSIEEPDKSTYKYVDKAFSQDSQEGDPSVVDSLPWKGLVF